MPALAVQTYNEIELRRSREAEVRQDALRLAKFAAGELDRIIDNGRALLVSLANLHSIRDHDAAACTAYVKALNRAFPQYRVIGAIDLAGKPFCASAPIPDGATMANRPHFKEAIKTGELAVGAYSTGRLIDEPIVPLLLPFRGPDDQVAGAVYVSLDPQWLAEYFRTTRPLDGRATLAVVDR